MLDCQAENVAHVRIDLLSVDLPLGRYSGSVNETLQEAKSLLQLDPGLVCVDTLGYFRGMCCRLWRENGIHMTEAAAFLSSFNAGGIADEDCFHGTTLVFTHSHVKRVPCTEKESAHLQRDVAWVDRVLARGSLELDAKWERDGGLSSSRAPAPG